MSVVQRERRGPSQELIGRLLTLRAGMLLDSTVPPGVDLSGITWWEELRSVGFNPETSTLLAVVTTKQATGYQGLRNRESTEYVRFFIDCGLGFLDAGVASFQIANRTPTSALDGFQHHIVQIVIPEARCREMRLFATRPRVRAVLSWNTEPSSDPETAPLFGNVLEGGIRLRAEMPGTLHSALDLDMESANARQQIPRHRLSYRAVHQLLQAAAAPGPEPWEARTSSLGVDLEQLLAVVTAPKADTQFEELTAVGLNVATGVVGGIVQLKKKAGYSGGQSGPKSREYVTFWADWDNDGVFEENLGTASVDVHDANGYLPGTGHCYAVSLPLPDLAERITSHGNPKSVRIRGVLSWAVSSPAEDPEALHAWGNRVDAHVRTTAAEKAMAAAASMGSSEVIQTTRKRGDEDGGRRNCEREVDREFLAWLLRLRPSGAAKDPGPLSPKKKTEAADSEDSFLSPGRPAPDGSLTAPGPSRVAMQCAGALVHSNAKESGLSVAHDPIHAQRIMGLW